MIFLTIQSNFEGDVCRLDYSHRLWSAAIDREALKWLY